MVKNLLTIICSLVLGVVVGFGGYVYITLPETEDLITGEVFYSQNNGDTVEAVPISSNVGDVSVHFLELGNKYTGDCTYIKVGENIDILIDCGSRSNSVATVSSYLNNYVTDGTLEFVIVTHAHRDHYAGFATGKTVDSIFDLYECDIIIDFALTNQQPGSTTYDNYLRELNDEITAGATHYTAADCWNNVGNAKRQFILDETNDISLNILYNEYYETKTDNENDYSVCTLLSQGDKHFIFTGDLDDETTLIEHNTLPQVEVYKAGHHGSGTSSSTDLMSAIRPKIVCVCCCAGSPEYKAAPENEFPTQAFVDRVSIYTKYIYVTSLAVKENNSWDYTSMNGNIVVMAKLNQQTGVNCSNNNTLLKDTEWFKANRTLPIGAIQ